MMYFILSRRVFRPRGRPARSSSSSSSSSSSRGRDGTGAATDARVLGAGRLLDADDAAASIGVRRAEEECRRFEAVRWLSHRPRSGSKPKLEVGLTRPRAQPHQRSPRASERREGVRIRLCRDGRPVRLHGRQVRGRRLGHHERAADHRSEGRRGEDARSRLAQAARHVRPEGRLRSLRGIRPGEHEAVRAEERAQAVDARGDVVHPRRARGRAEERAVSSEHVARRVRVDPSTSTSFVSSRSHRSFLVSRSIASDPFRRRSRARVASSVAAGLRRPSPASVDRAAPGTTPRSHPAADDDKSNLSPPSIPPPPPIGTTNTRTTRRCTSSTTSRPRKR